MYPPREGALRWRGVPRQDVAREAHGGVKSQLASRLRPLSRKATHPPNYRSLHITFTTVAKFLPVMTSSSTCASKMTLCPSTVMR